jgi:hypothetical protein
VSGTRHVIALSRAIDAAGRLPLVAEAQDEITRADGVVTRLPSYWVMDGKPVEMINANTFVVPETGEQLMPERSV